MRPFRPLALVLLLAAFALAPVPAASLAQSAGDNQYQDPLGGGGGSTTTPSTPSTPSGGSGSGGSQGASQPAAPSAAATATPSSGNTSRTSKNVPLARTGFDAWLPGLAGVLLLAGGAALLLLPGRQARRR